ASRTTPHPGTTPARPGAPPARAPCPGRALVPSWRVCLGSGPPGAGRCPLQPAAAPHPRLPLWCRPWPGVAGRGGPCPVGAGLSESGAATGQEGLSLAHELSHPLSLAMALSQVSRLHGLRREWPAAQERAEALMALAREQGFPQQLATSLVHWGWTLAAQGLGEKSIPQIHQGLAAYRVTGAEISRAQYLALLAEAYGTGGQPAEGLRVLA